MRKLESQLHPLRLGDHSRIQLVVGLLLAVILSPTKLHAQAYCAQGVAEMRMYVHGAVQEQPRMHYTITVSGCNWFIRTIRDQGTNALTSPDYSEFGFDGTNTYYLCCLKETIARQRAMGRSLPGGNVALAQVFRGEVFNHEMDAEVGPIWLTFASACYLRARTNTLVVPPMPFDSAGTRYSSLAPRTLQADWTLSESLPTYPRRVAFFDEGSVPAPGGRAQRTPPFSTGFVSAIFEVHEFRTFGTLTVPTSSTLRIFTPAAGATSNTNLVVFVEFTVTASTASGELPALSFRPRLPGTTLITDTRFGLFNYMATKDWPTEGQVTNSQSFGAFKRMQSEPHGNATQKRLVARTLLALALIAPAAAYAVRRLRTKPARSP